MTQFFETVMGRAFYEGTVPSLVEQIKRVADALDIQNELSVARTSVPPTSGDNFMTPEQLSNSGTREDEFEAVLTTILEEIGPAHTSILHEDTYAQARSLIDS